MVVMMEMGMIRPLDLEFSIYACDGRKTIGDAKSVFKRGIENSFLENLGQQRKTERIKVKPFEIIKDFKFTEVFSCFSGDFDSLCFIEDQIVKFCKHEKEFFLKNKNENKDSAVFMLYKVGFDFWVCQIVTLADELSINRFKLGNPIKLKGKYLHKVIIPIR